jgi:N6-L-threonylcarbamoyladenine synthase
MKILGLETSCDETAAGVVEDGRVILSNVIRTQFDLHGRYGGVVPELASRRHVEAILPTAQEALDRAGLAIDDLDGLAVTRGPGLVGSLLVGLNFAKAAALVTGLPVCGVDHLNAHMAAGLLDPDPPPYPWAGAVVSGGHTNLYVARGPLDLELKGRTRDDAAGEAYDKAAKFLGLGYPGGELIDDLAAAGDPERFFLPRPMLGRGLDFSFSGLKTALVHLATDRFGSRPPEGRDLSDLCASFQAAVIDVVIGKLRTLVELEQVRALVLAGGVAANRGLRRAAGDLAVDFGLRLVLPPTSLCTDNGAMIAALGFYELDRGGRLDLAADAYSRWPAAR